MADVVVAGNKKLEGFWRENAAEALELEVEAGRKRVLGK